MPNQQWLRLKHLISSLSQNEKAYFKKVLKASLAHPNRKSKLIALLDSFEENLQAPHQYDYAANRKQLELLEERILDNLLSDVNLYRDDNTNGVSVHLVIQKKFLKAQILSERSVMQRAFGLASTCASSAIKFEDYDLALQCMRMQLAMVSLHQCENNFHALVQKIDHYDYCNQLKNRGIRLYRELKLKKYLRMLENLDYFVAHSLQKLLKMQKKIQSPTLDFIYLYFEKERNELTGNPRQALQLLAELHNSSTRISGKMLTNSYELLSEKGRLNFEMGFIDEARTCLRESINILPIESDSHQEARDLLFLMEYFEQNYEDCKKHISSFTGTSYFKEVLPNVHRQRWLFYNCSLLLSLRESKKCLKKINELFLCGKPSPEINLQLRMISAMCHIDRGMFDLADKEMESLRKYISRYKLQHHLESLRLQTFFEILWQLRYCGYDFSKLQDRGLDIQAFQKDRNDHQKKKPLSYGLVPYVNWLQQQLSPHSQNDASVYHELHQYRRKLMQETGRVSGLYR